MVIILIFIAIGNFNSNVDAYAIYECLESARQLQREKYKR